MWRLSAASAETVPSLAKHLKPVGIGEQTRLQGALASLENRDFASRERAEQHLRTFGRSVEPALRQELVRPSGAEARKRLKDTLAATLAQPRRPQQLRELRAIAILEMTGTNEAKTLLKALAAGAAGFSLTEDATSALRRLEQRSK